MTNSRVAKLFCQEVIARYEDEARPLIDELKKVKDELVEIWGKQNKPLSLLSEEQRRTAVSQQVEVHSFFDLSYKFRSIGPEIALRSMNRVPQNANSKSNSFGDSTFQTFIFTSLGPRRLVDSVGQTQSKPTNRFYVRRYPFQP